MVTKPADLDLGKGYRYGWHDESTSINVPFIKTFKPDLLISAWLHHPWTYPLAFSVFFGFLMLVLVGGKARTLNEFRAIAGQAGLEVRAVGRQASGRGIVECRPVEGA